MPELFPASWYKAEMEQYVVDFIRHLPIPVGERKKLLMVWCDRAGVAVTADLVRRATWGRPGEV